MSVDNKTIQLFCEILLFRLVPRSCHEALRSNSSEVRLKDANKDINKLNGTLTDDDSGNYTLVGWHEDSAPQLTMNNTAHNQPSTAEKHTDLNNGNSVFVHKTLIYTVMGVLLLKISL